MGTTQLETAPEPKYWHLKTVLSEALDQDFAVGEVLPNERELAARFGVARATLRQALEQLELEGGCSAAVAWAPPSPRRASASPWAARSTVGRARASTAGSRWTRPRPCRRPRC